MPHTRHPSIGHYLAFELFNAKAHGETLTKQIVGDRFDILIEQWNQTAPQTAIPSTPSPALSPAEAIYAAYPRKVGKMAALKAINLALKKTPHVANHPDVILQATKDYAAAVATWPARDRAYIPHASTWFNRGSYLDDPKEWQRGHSAVTNTTARDYSSI